MGKSKQSKPRQQKPTVVVDNTQQQATVYISHQPAVAGAGEPPKPTALCIKVKAHMDSFRNATTTELHALAIECMEHAAGSSGDLRPLLTFQNELPKSLRKVAFMQWVSAFGPVKWGKRDKMDNADGIKKDTSAEAKPWNLEGARKVTFYDLQEQATPMYKHQDMLKKLIAANKQIEEALNDPKLKRKDNETDEQLRGIHARNLKAITALMAAA